MRSPVNYDLAVCVACFQTIPHSGIESLCMRPFPVPYRLLAA